MSKKIVFFTFLLSVVHTCLQDHRLCLFSFVCVFVLHLNTMIYPLFFFSFTGNESRSRPFGTHVSMLLVIYFNSINEFGFN